MKSTIAWLLALAVVTATIAAEAPRKIRPVPTPLPRIRRKGEVVVKETWDWAKAMIPVARKFTGTEGVVVFAGDSITYANQSTRWGRNVAFNRKGGYTASDKAILRWSHAYDGKKDTNGYYLASVDRPSGRSETAASGITTAQYLKGGFHGLPPLSAILKKYNPQIVMVLLGSNDARGRDPLDVLKDMNTIIEMILANHSIPVLTTLPPARNQRMHERIKRINELYLGLAAARKIPIIDLYGEFVSRQPDGKWQGTLVGPDGVHLTHKLADGPPTPENLKNCGYLLRCWLSVQKLKEIKAKVIDQAKKKAGVE